MQKLTCRRWLYSSSCSSYDHWSLKKEVFGGKHLHCQQLNHQKSIQRSANSNSTLILMISCLRYSAFINCPWIYFPLPVVIFSSEQVKTSHIKSIHCPWTFLSKCGFFQSRRCLLTHNPHIEIREEGLDESVFRLCNKTLIKNLI